MTGNIAKRTRKARTVLLAALTAGGAIFLSGLGGCVVRGGYSSGPVSFGVGWQTHAGHAFRCR